MKPQLFILSSKHGTHFSGNQSSCGASVVPQYKKELKKIYSWYD